MALIYLSGDIIKNYQNGRFYISMSIIQTFFYKDLFPDITILRTVDTKQLIINFIQCIYYANKRFRIHQLTVIINSGLCEFKIDVPVLNNISMHPSNEYE